MDRQVSRDVLGYIREALKASGFAGTAGLVVLAQLSLDLEDDFEMLKPCFVAAIPLINESLRRRGIDKKISLDDPDWPQFFE